MAWSLALLTPWSLLASDLPRGWAWPLALAAAGWAVFDALRQRASPPRRLVVPSGRGAATCDGERMHGLEIAWRGPLAFLRWRDARGCRHRLSFWPDTLDAGMRRELVIAMQRRLAASDPGSVAG